MTQSIWQPLNHSLQDKENLFDIIIIGGGIAGISTAYSLSKQSPKARIGLLESSYIGYGATGRNAGFLLAGTADHYSVSVKEYGRERARNVFATTVGTQKRVKEFIKEYPKMNFDYIPSGSFTLAGDIDEEKILEESCILLREDGFDVEFLSKDPLNRGFYGGIKNSADGCLHPVKFIKNLADVASNINLKIFEYTSVLGYESTNNCIEIFTDKFKLPIKTNKVLLALNAYSPLVDSFFSDKIFPKRGQCLVTKPIEKQILDKIVYVNNGYDYFRQLPNGRFLFGGGRHKFIESEVGHEDSITSGVQQYLEEFMHTHFPELREIEIDMRWSGTMGFSVDGLPLLGRLPNQESVYFSAGFTGHGMGYSLEIGNLAAEMLLTEKIPLLFDATRLNQLNKG